MEKTVLRTPPPYYGGRQQACADNSGMIPEHKVYCEPFCGGAAIFFAQEPSKAEIISFCGVPQRDFPALKREIEISPRSRKQRRQAWVISRNPDMFDRVKRAWAVRMPASASYACRLDGAFSCDHTGTVGTKMANKRADFKTDYAIRLQRAQIECRDALRVIRSRDTPGTFFRIDPPYAGTDTGHYDGYSRMDFDALPALPETLQGKFPQSSFHNQSPADCTVKNDRHMAEICMASPMTHGGSRTHRGKAEEPRKKTKEKSREKALDMSPSAYPGPLSGHAAVRQFHQAQFWKGLYSPSFPVLFSGAFSMEERYSRQAVN